MKSKIYTKTGDLGATKMADGTVIQKDHNRVVIIGEIDELNSVLGIIISIPNVSEKIKKYLLAVQVDLFDLGAEISLYKKTSITASHVAGLERQIDEFDSAYTETKGFVMPGGKLASAVCHLGRTVCRRAERKIISLRKIEKVDKNILKYINRLSDLLFVMANVMNASTN